MFNIALKQEQYQTYILTDSETNSRLEIVPERGGIVSKWKIQGQDILFLDAERFANPKLTVRGGIPILFPICGNLPDNIYIHNGRQYSLPQHGFARNIPWEVTEQNIENCASLTLVLNSNEQTYAVYPFDFQITFTYEIKGNSLKIKQSYLNQSSEIMPFSVGFHPYFWLRDKSKLELAIPASEYQDQRTKITHPFTGNFNFDEPEIDCAFTSLSDNSSSLRDTQSRWQVAIAFSELFSTLVFWTVAGKEYVCLEPWSAPRNALNTKEQLNYIEPGNTYEAWIEMNVSYF